MNAAYAQGLGRAFIGALLFALPLFMTMEMWELGFTMDRMRLAALLVITLPMLVGLAHYAGFERTFGFVDDVLDTFAAIAVAAITAATTLLLFGVLGPSQPLPEIVAKIAALTFPAALGALLADKLLSQPAHHNQDDMRGFFGRLFLMGVGALFVALNVAPTEEMALIAFQIGPWTAALLAIVSLVLLHALLFWVDFPGRAMRRRRRHWSELTRATLAGYGICAMISLGLLWTFGRTDHASAPHLVELVIVLSFPAAIGAGLAQVVVAERNA